MNQSTKRSTSSKSLNGQLTFQGHISGLLTIILKKKNFKSKNKISAYERTKYNASECVCNENKYASLSDQRMKSFLISSYEEEG